MKKLAITVLAAGLALSATACSPTKLSNQETCERVNLVVSTPAGSNTGKAGTTRLANAIRPVEAVASDDLKPALRGILKFLDESIKKETDQAKLEELRPEYEKGVSTYNQFCSQAG
ncbi:hypothetical protein [Arthrobacter sp. M4]|uniref:hypothetical protein n=1 Tax=Arthrobacter sp. M4 TaxID=218160 RepID=UPI001CDD09F1|nr:hypothetical protein [Arthrobacter sp. M4]MCA4134177.1 hypothetical protein [Arthrobacter sp. M4]